MFIDPIADLITKIRNANQAKLHEVEIQTSNLTTAILTILKNEGYILGFDIKTFGHSKKKKTIVKLKYKKQTPSIRNIKQISKPGLRVYVPVEKMPKVLNGLGIAIVSTNKGVITNKQAVANNVGGEVIAYVW